MPIVPVFCCGFECGADGAHWTLTNATFSTTTVNNGARSLRCNPSANVHKGTATLAASANFLVMRCYVRFTTLPNATVPLLIANNGFNEGAYFQSSDNKIYAGYNGGSVTLGATGVSVTTGTWYRIDVLVNANANPHLTDVKVDGTSCGQASNATAAGSMNSIIAGNQSANATGDWFYDDFIASQTSGDYPIGAGKVLASSPFADGTHTFTGTNAVVGNAGAAITVTSTTVYQLLDDVPLALNTSDFVNQQTSSPTQYVDVLFATATASDAPRAVELIMAGHKGSTAAADDKWKLLDNGTTFLAWQHGGSSAAGSSQLTFQTKQYASLPGGGAWTKARADALHLRWGYSTDANPDVYADCAMLEWEFAASVAGVDLGSAGWTGTAALSIPQATGILLTIPIAANL